MLKAVCLSRDDNHDGLGDFYKRINKIMEKRYSAP